MVWAIACALAGTVTGSIEARGPSRQAAEPDTDAGVDLAERFDDVEAAGGPARRSGRREVPGNVDDHVRDREQMEIDRAVGSDRHHDQVGPLITGAIRVEVRRTGERRTACARAQVPGRVGFIGDCGDDEDRCIHRCGGGQIAAIGDRHPNVGQRGFRYPW